MQLIDLIKLEWKYSKFIARTTCATIILSMLPLLSWASVYNEIDQLSLKCKAGDKKACSELANIAKKDKDWQVCLHAVRGLTSQALLADIAKNDLEKHVRMADADKLDDKALAQIVYTDMAKNDNDDNFRRTAVKKLTNQVLLADIVNCDKNGDLMLQ